jgi:hypothetical protein
MSLFVLAEAELPPSKLSISDARAANQRKNALTAAPGKCKIVIEGLRNHYLRILSGERDRILFFFAGK